MTASTTTTVPPSTPPQRNPDLLRRLLAAEDLVRQLCTALIRSLGEGEQPPAVKDLPDTAAVLAVGCLVAAGGELLLAHGALLQSGTAARAAPLGRALDQARQVIPVMLPAVPLPHPCRFRPLPRRRWGCCAVGTGTTTW